MIIVLPLRLISGFILVLACAMVAAAQGTKPAAKPDFTGTWLLDEKKSSDSGLTTRPDLPLKITHTDPELRITRPAESNGQIVEKQFVYFTDGRGETNEATSLLTTNPSAVKSDDLRNRVAISKTKWSDKKIVTRIPLRLTVGGHFVEFEQIDQWKLSDDGKVLTQTSHVVFRDSDAAFVPNMAQDKKRVYNRG